MPRVSEIKVRRSPRITAGDVPGWETVNPILAVGELGLNTDNKDLKIGDNYTAWNSLPGITAKTLTTTLPTSLGGSGGGSTSYSGPLSMISLASDYTLTGAGGSGAGSFASTDTVPLFPSGAALLANTVYEIDADIFYRLTPSNSSSPRFYTLATNGLTLQASGADLFILAGNQTTTSVPSAFVKGERWNTGASAVALTVTTATLPGASNPGLKLTIRGVIRTNAAGTFNLGLSISNGTTTNSKTVAGSYMKLTRIGAVDSSADSIGSWS